MRCALLLCAVAFGCADEGCRVKISSEFENEELVSIIRAVDRWEKTGAVECEVLVLDHGANVVRRDYEGGLFGWCDGSGAIDLYLPLPEEAPSLEVVMMHELGHRFGHSSHHDELGVMNDSFHDNCLTSADLDPICSNCRPEECDEDAF